MLRTQIYLPEEIYQKLLYLKRVKRVSVAQIIRETLEKHLDKENKVATGKDLLELAKHAVKGGRRDLSAKFNEYLYGKK